MSVDMKLRSDWPMHSRVAWCVAAWAMSQSWHEQRTSLHCPCQRWATAGVAGACGGLGCPCCWVRLRVRSTLRLGAGSLRCPALESPPGLQPLAQALAAHLCCKKCASPGSMRARMLSSSLRKGMDPWMAPGCLLWSQMWTHGTLRVLALTQYHCPDHWCLHSCIYKAMPPVDMGICLCYLAKLLLGLSIPPDGSEVCHLLTGSAGALSLHVSRCRA